MSEQLFIQATRQKFRFVTPKGLASTEDLWDLPLKGNTREANLDDIAKNLYQQIQDSSAVASFVDETKATDVTAQTMLDVVKYVIGVKKLEAQAAADARAKRERAQRIMQILDRKDNEALEGKSPEELRAELAGLIG